MKKWIAFVMMYLVSSTWASEPPIECQSRLDKYRYLSDEESIKVAFDYRENYFSDEKDMDAFCIFQYLTDKGNLEAQTALSSFYLYGNFVEQNSEKAFNMVLNGVNKGSATALNNLGSYYFNGQYVKQDYKKAVDYYQQAIEKGNTLAKVSLSWAYFAGAGVPQDISKAIELALEVAKQPGARGQSMAMTNLGFYYRHMGLKKDELYWTEQAANLYDPAAQGNLASIYAKDPEFFDKEKALFWLNKAMARGNPKAFFLLGSYYDRGTRAFDRDPDKAFSLYEQAAMLGHGMAQYQLATKLYKTQREKAALNWYLKAANENNVLEAMCTLAQLYAKGSTDIPQDTEQAQYWLNKAKAYSCKCE